MNIWEGNKKNTFMKVLFFSILMYSFCNMSIVFFNTIFLVDRY